VSRKAKMYAISSVVFFTAVLFVVSVLYMEQSVIKYKKDLEKESLRISSFLLNSFLYSFEKKVSDMLLKEDLSISRLDELNQKFSQFCSFVVWMDLDGNVVKDLGKLPTDDLYNDLLAQTVLYEDYGTFLTDLYPLSEGLQIRTATILQSSEGEDLVFVSGTMLPKEFFSEVERLTQRKAFFVSKAGEIFGEGFSVDEGLLKKASESHSPEIHLTADGKLLSVIPVFDFQEWNLRGLLINCLQIEPFKKSIFRLQLVGFFLFLVSSISLVVGILVVARKGARDLRFLPLFSFPLFLTVLYIFIFQIPGTMQREYANYVESTAKVLSDWGKIYFENRRFEDVKRLMNVQVMLSQNGNIVLSTFGKGISRTLEKWRSSYEIGNVEVGKVRVNKVGFTYWKMSSGERTFIVLKEETPLVNSVARVRLLGVIVVAVFVTFLWIFSFAIKNAERPRFLRATLIGYIFLAPALIHLIWWAVGPVAFSMILAFQRWNVVDPAKPFVGLDNFRELFRDKLFWNAMKNTALFSLQVPISMFLSLLLAIAVNRPTKSMALLRTVYYLPVVTAGVSTTIVWRWIFNKDFGILNYVLGIFGVPKIPWLTSPNTALIAIMLLSIWQSLGSQMVIFLAGLQSIPQAFYEAASIDGANRFQRFSKITLPLLKPTTMFVLITSVIGSFQVFTPVYVLTQGGPLRSTDVVFYHIWEAAWIELRMGYAAAQSWMLFLVLLVLTYFQFKLFGKESWQQYF